MECLGVLYRILLAGNQTNDPPRPPSPLQSDHASAARPGQWRFCRAFMETKGDTLRPLKTFSQKMPAVRTYFESMTFNGLLEHLQDTMVFSPPKTMGFL